MHWNYPVTPAITINFCKNTDLQFKFKFRAITKLHWKQPSHNQRIRYNTRKPADEIPGSWAWISGKRSLKVKNNKIIPENGQWLSSGKPIANEQWNHIRFLLQRETCGNQKNHREIRDCCNICSPRTTLLRYDGPLPWQKKLPGREAFFLSTRIDFWRKPKPFQVGAKISN